MAKKKMQEESAQTAPDQDGTAAADGEKISKMEAVRRLLAEDPDMKPNDGIEAVKARFGLEMSVGNFSAYKSQIKAKAGGRSQASAGPKKRKAATDVTRQVGTADPLEAAQAVKALVDRFGAGTVKGLADLFGQEGHG